MANSLRIGLDCDGVLVNWELQARKSLEGKFGVKLPMSSEWDSIKNSIDPDQWEWLWGDGIQGVFSLVEEYPGAFAGAVLLRDFGSVSIITSVPRSVVFTRVQWLISHGILFDEFRNTPNGEPKSTVLPLCDVYIDDGPHVAKDIIENTDKIMILWNRPWNSCLKINSDRLHRVDSWDSVIKIVGGML